jgi:L-lactate dehydrogenase (cytochrome)
MAGKPAKPPRGLLARCHNVADLRAVARRRLPAPMFHYIDGGADDEWTLAHNTRAFEQFELVPRYLRDVEHIDLRTRVLGFDLDMPLYCSPTAMNRLFHHRGEIAVAEAARDAGTLYSLSSIASSTIQEVGTASAGPKMFQIYVFRDRGLNDELLAACREHGFAATCLTVDVPVAGNRERDLRTGMTIPPKLTFKSLFDIALHPAWWLRYLTGPEVTVANVAHRIAEGSASISTVVEYFNNQVDPSVTWEDAARLREQWDGPFAIKGILSVADAIRSAEIGASAVIVSNHGGRQLEGAPAPIEVLPDIVDAVGDRLEVILEGGVRRGNHVVKALALGATACAFGRPYLYGLASAGRAGVDRVLDLMRAELARSMALTGCTRISELDRSYIRRVQAAPP